MADASNYVFFDGACMCIPNGSLDIFWVGHLCLRQVNVGKWEASMTFNVPSELFRLLGDGASSHAVEVNDGSQADLCASIHFAMIRTSH